MPGGRCKYGRLFGAEECCGQGVRKNLRVIVNYEMQRSHEGYRFSRATWAACFHTVSFRTFWGTHPLREINLCQLLGAT